MKKILSSTFIMSLIISGCGKPKDTAPNFTVQSDKVFFTTFAYGSEGWNHLYSISTSDPSLAVNDEFTGTNGFEPSLFQANTNGKISTLYFSQYQSGQSGDVTLAVRDQGIIGENTALPQNLKDMLLSVDGLLVSVGYDNGQISVVSPNFEETYLTKSSLGLYPVGPSSSTSNLIGVLYGHGNYFAVSSGSSSPTYIPTNTSPNIYKLGYKEGNEFSGLLSIPQTTAVQVEGSTAHDDKCLSGISSQIRLSRSRMVVTCNAQYTTPSTPQTLNIFLIDVISGSPFITKLLSKTVSSEYVFTLGGLSKDRTKVLVTESKGFMGKILNTYWLDTNKYLGENTTPVYNVANSVVYNAASNTYLFSCVQSQDKSCVKGEFALSSTDMTTAGAQFRTINLNIPLGDAIKFPQIIN